MMFIYTFNCIMAGKDSKQIEIAIAEIAADLEITDEGEFDEYLEVKVERKIDRSFNLMQPLLIDQILMAIGFNEQTRPKETPALAIRIIKRDVEGPHHKIAWDITGEYWDKINFHKKSTQKDIAFTDP